MQQYADSIVQSVGIIVAAISTLLTVLAPLVGLITSAFVSSGYIAADSKFAVLIAKLFPLSMHATSSLKSKKPSIPPGAIALLFVGLLGFGHSGCAFFRSPTFWEGVNTTCEIALTATPEVKAKALATGTPAGDIAAILCGIADVIEPFAKEEVAKKEGRRMAGEPAVRQAVAIATEKGLL